MIRFNATPLEKYASLHVFPILSLFGITSKKSPSIKLIFNFNLEKSIKSDNKAQLSFNLRDANMPPTPGTSDFCIKHLTRWRMNLSLYESFSDFLLKIKRKNYRSYRRALKTFEEYGATISLIEGDWSDYADSAHRLYLNVAEKHKAQLYDLNFFRMIAKSEPFQLLCVWYQGSLVGILVLIDEGETLHSMVCGLDYNHTKKAHAYSRMHYEFIRLAFEAKKYTMADIGLTADSAKSLLDFQPVAACMDVSAENPFLKGILRLISRFMTSTINEQSQFKWKFQFLRPL